MKIKLNKRQTKNHNGTMTVDITFISPTESFTKPFVFPIDYKISDMKDEAKEYIEDYVDSETLAINPEEEINIDNITTDRQDRRNYNEKKRRLKEYLSLVDIGVYPPDFPAIAILRTQIRNLHKEKFK